MKEQIIGTGGVVVELSGIPLETPLLDREGKPVLNQQGEPIMLRAAPVKDDFSTVGPEPATVVPRSDAPCGRCGEVHTREGYPLCICIKCAEYGRIIWCGYCQTCVYKRFSELANVGPEIAIEVVDAMVPGFKAHTQKVRHDAAKMNKLDWET